MKLSFVICIIALLSLNACDDNCSDLTTNELTDCRGNGTLPDSLTLAQNIVGNWRWIEHTGGYGEELPNCADKKVTVTFRSDGTFDETEEDAVITSGTWNVSKSIHFGWLLEMEGDPYYINDLVWFCQNYVIFEPSYVLDTGYHIFRNVD